MNWKKIVLPLAAIPILALLIFGLLRGDATIVESPWPGRPAPDFKRETLNGDSLHLASLRGHVVVLNFWASWCIPCLDEHPLLVAANERWRDQGVRIVGVVYQDTPANARQWLKEQGGSWTHILDPGSRLSIEYGLFGVPETFFIDRNGVVRYKQIGPINANDLDKWISKLLADSGAVAPATSGTE